MTETLSFVAPDGTTFLLSDRPHKWLRQMAGRGMPPVELRETPDWSGQGSVLDQIRDGARTVDVPVLVSGDLRDNLRALARGMHGRAGEGRLVSVYDGGTRELPCRLVAGLDWVESMPHLQNGLLSFRAFDPYWQDAGSTVLTFGPGEFGTWLPFLPVRVVSDSVYTEATVDNTGDVEAWPVWTLSGPFDGVTLRSDGNILQVDAVFADGDGIVVDTRPGFKTVTDFAGVSRFDALDLVNDTMFPLVAGSNDVEIDMESVGPSTSVSLSYRRRWLTA